MNRFLVGFLGCIVANAARFGTFFDSACTKQMVNAVVFSDVCTWSSNRFADSYALTLSSCSNTEFQVTFFSLTDDPVCEGSPLVNITLNSSCIPYNGVYLQGIDFSCESQNTTYNLLAHFTPTCQDGGYAFSMELGAPLCLQDSFGPGVWDFDAQGSYKNGIYSLELYSSTNGTCVNELTTFQTTVFPAHCLAPIQSFETVYLDIYNAFPIHL